MHDPLPTANEKLDTKQIEFLKIFTKNCKRTILRMLKTSQSGHPGGSLSSLDILAVLYAFRISQTYEKIVVSNGHISPGVYSVLAEIGVIDREEVIRDFRRLGSVYEGHVTRHIPGIYFGTGPLGVGVSAASGFALAEKLCSSVNNKKTPNIFCLMGDGEAQEGQVQEMALFAAKEKLDNFVVFCDYNRVQLTDNLEKTMPINIAENFRAFGWNVSEIDGHDYEAIWKSINSIESNGKPTLILAKTIMGKGISMMEEDGKNLKSTWHGKTPSREEIDKILESDELKISNDELEILGKFRKARNYQPQKNLFVPNLEKETTINPGTPIVYGSEVLTDCRTAYGKALLDLAEKNQNILAGTADLGGSVMTKFVKEKYPDQHLEFGICEQNMVSVAGGLSVSRPERSSSESCHSPFELSHFVPFISTFGAFMSSRAKDQARVNDINQTNVKMVSTHCGLSVGEDGPTHQSIDDMGSFLGFFNTQVLEPADPNQCDRMIRYAASHYGNFYIRMGRHKIPNLTKEDGKLLFDENYAYYYGRTDILRSGSAVTIVASGPMVFEAKKAVESAKFDAEIVIASSPKKFDENLQKSLEKTKKVIVVEDHNRLNGYGSQIALFSLENDIKLDFFRSISVREYQLSGTPLELYEKAEIGEKAIVAVLNSMNL